MAIHSSGIEWFFNRIDTKWVPQDTASKQQQSRLYCCLFFVFLRGHHTTSLILPHRFGAAMEKNVANRMKELISQSLGVSPPEVVDDASFIDDLGADSLDIVELVMAIEKEFGIEIPDEDAEKITNVRQAIEYVEKRI